MLASIISPTTSLGAQNAAGPCEVVVLLGVAKSGDVYRGRDTKLRREFALKVLPEGFAAVAEQIRSSEETWVQRGVVGKESDLNFTKPSFSNVCKLGPFNRIEKSEPPA